MQGWGDYNALRDIYEDDLDAFYSPREQLYREMQISNRKVFCTLTTLHIDEIRR